MPITVFFATVILKLIVINCQRIRKVSARIDYFFIALHRLYLQILYYSLYLLLIITLCERQIYINTY